MERHTFNDDGSGISCDDCGRPKAATIHLAAHAPPVQIANAGSVLTPNQTETSQRAALATAWPKAGTHRELILSAVAATGTHGATDQDLAFDTDLSDNTIRPRRGELVKIGLLRLLTDDAGEPVVRLTPGGHDAQVWVLTDRARSLEPEYA